MNDLVVVVPGIMGSALYRNDRPIWDPSMGGMVNALATLGGSIRSLALPPEIGDHAPADGVRAAHLLHDLHVIPGLWTPIRGYNGLVHRLRKIGFTQAKGNLLELPYDWRTSVKRVVATEAPKIETALTRWRAQHPANAAARIVFIAHSLGGLVARYYAATHPHVGKIITIGTPSRGSMKALQVLTKGVGPDWGWLQNMILPLANSLPSLHQLLPSYPCVDTDGDYQNFDDLKGQDIHGLNAAMASAGIDFLDELALLETADPHFPQRLHPLIGWRQDTPASVRITAGEPTFQTTYGGLTLSGDGTVPHAGAIPKTMPLDTPLVHGFPDHHGNLQENSDVLTEIVRILTEAPPVVLRGDETPASLAMPELILAGQDLTVDLSIPPESREAVAVTLNPGTHESTERRPQLAHGRGQVSFTKMAAGIHTITVTGIGQGSPIQPVTGTVTVWNRDWETD
jgi:pimeloyl-ACP methyl ester carboxylesterase